jgi:hypothetical protein
MLDAYKSNRKKTGRRPRKSKNKQDTSSDESEPEEIFQIPLVARKKSADVNTRELEAKHAGSRPAAQIVPESSLGVTLGNVARLAKDPDDPDDPSESSSEYEGTSYSGSRSDISRSSSRSRRRHRHRSKKRSKKRSRQRSRHCSKGCSNTIKPIPPKDYDGVADA